MQLFVKMASGTCNVDVLGGHTMRDVKNAIQVRAAFVRRSLNASQRGRESEQLHVRLGKPLMTTIFARSYACTLRHCARGPSGHDGDVVARASAVRIGGPARDTRHGDEVVHRSRVDLARLCVFAAPEPTRAKTPHGRCTPRTTGQVPHRPETRRQSLAQSSTPPAQQLVPAVVLVRTHTPAG